MTRTTSTPSTSPAASRSPSDSAGGAGISRTARGESARHYLDPAGPSRRRQVFSLPSEDVPIPSVESASGSLSDTTSTGGTPGAQYTPQVSLSPPPPSQHASIPSRSATAATTSVVAEPRDAADIEQGLVNLQLTSPDAFNLGGMERELDGVAGPSTHPVNRLSPQPPSSHRRRRSSTRAPTVPYEVSDEQPPPDRFHEPAFQQAFKDSKAVVAELRDVLSSSTVHVEPDSTMRKLYSEADKLAAFNCQSTRTVGFVGDTGVGKTSLLNALLDLRKIARASSSGEACTCVATEYHYHNSNVFKIEIDAFSQEELKKQLTDLLKSYRHYHLHRDSMEITERTDFEKRAKVAKDTFQVMFRGRLENEQFLIRASETAVLQTLFQWAEEASQAIASDIQIVPTAEECSRIIYGLTSETTQDNQPAVWPYLRKIKVFTNAYILSKGLILTDLPGLRDLNTARRNIAEQYMRSCDEIFVVCNIIRAVDDAGVMAVFELGKQAKFSSVGIICTRSDDIRADEAVDDRAAAITTRDVRRLQQAVTSCESALRDLRGDLDSLLPDDGGELHEEDTEEYLRLSALCKRKENDLKDKKFELKRYIVKRRNREVSAQLATKYAGYIPDSVLSVFCVSSFDYWENRSLGKDAAEQHMELNQIPMVRRHCVSLVAESQLRAAKHYIQYKIPVLMEKAELWIESGAGTRDAERMLAICEKLNALEARITERLTGRESSISTLGKRMKRDFKRDIYDFYGERAIGQWSGGAQDASYVWGGWHHATYSAFGRNFGEYTTPAVGYHCWNKEAMECMVGDVAAPFRNVCTAVREDEDTIKDLVSTEIEWARDFLHSEVSTLTASTVILSQALFSREHLMTAEIEDVFNQSSTNLATLRTDALSGIRTSIFGREMEASYNACSHESGTGSHARRKAIIQGKLRDQGLFETLMGEFRRRFNEIAINLQEQVTAAVRTHLDVINGTLDIIRDENAANESERNPQLRAAINEQIVKARAEMERIQPIAAS